MNNLSVEYNEAVNVRLQNDPAFSLALLDEAISLFLNGEPNTTRLSLGDIVNATVGFENLAVEIDKPSKSLHRMRSAKGNPTMNSLTKIISILSKHLNVNIEVHTVPCH